MSHQRKFLAQDRSHAEITTERWLANYQFHNSDQPYDYDEVAKREGSFPGCFKCQYYIELSGVLGMDWGVCSNERSPLDSKIVFEHDSCKEFSYAADEEEFK